MLRPEVIITSLRLDNSRLYKENIITTQAKQNNIEFFSGCRLALENLVTFGLKQIPEKTDADGPGLSWDHFYSVVSNFISRASTGNSARQDVIDLMKVATQDQWNNWYRLILIKDLKSGVSVKTINKAVKKFPQFEIPEFSPQLAHDSTKYESKMTGKKLVDTKMDGVRLLSFVYPNGEVIQFSRNGKEMLNFGHIKNQLSQIASSITEPWVFDGEVMSKSFQDLMKQARRKRNVDAGDASLFLFDMIPLSAFEQGIYKVKQLKRSQDLLDLYTKYEEQMPNVQVLGQELVDLNTSAGKKRFQEINRAAIEAGFEGIMLKDPDAIYQCKRSFAWLKLKPYIEVTLTIQSLEEGTGKNLGILGAFVCQGVDDGRKILVNVGGGFSDDNRREFWERGTKLIGQLVEVRADAITKNQDGEYYSLRFPRFIRFRGFTAGEKL